ncbi:MAG: zinc ribbon domain-containing protein [Anaerolineae bacterium]|nr:zinc ribbon domain-containing protein [Anaerolineae bacterium]
MEESELLCPSCGESALVPHPGGGLVCPQCDATYEMEDQRCPVCGADNPPTAKYCNSCGRALDLVGFVLQHRLQTPRERLAQSRLQAQSLKDEAEAASQERMGQWWVDEQERRRSLAAARAKQKKQEQQVLVGLLIVIGLVVVAVIAYVVWASVGPGTPQLTPMPLL